MNSFLKTDHPRKRFIVLIIFLLMILMSVSMATARRFGVIGWIFFIHADHLSG